MSDASEVPTAGRDAAQATQLPRRAAVEPYSQRRKPTVLKELAPKHRLLIEYMVTGSQHASIANRVGLEPGVAMSLIEAADALRIRRRQARDLSRQDVFMRAHASELQAFREGHKGEALRKVVQVMRAEGENKAADRKVQLEAASRLLGDAIAQGSGGVTVNVGVGIGIGGAVSPGLVIDLTGDDVSGGQADRQRGQPPMRDVTPQSVKSGG